MKDIVSETIIAVADKIIEMLFASNVDISVSRGWCCLSEEDLKFLIRRQLMYPERNQLKDFEFIEKLEFDIGRYFSKKERKESINSRDFTISKNTVDLIDMFLRGDLCRIPNDSDRQKIEEYRSFVVVTLIKRELSAKSIEQRKARIAKKALEAEESTQ